MPIPAGWCLTDHGHGERSRAGIQRDGHFFHFGGLGDRCGQGSVVGTVGGCVIASFRGAVFVIAYIAHLLEGLEE